LKGGNKKETVGEGVDVRVIENIRGERKEKTGRGW